MGDATARPDALLRARRAALGLDEGLTAQRKPRSKVTEQASATVRDRAIFAAFCVLTIAITGLQIFAIPVGDDAYVSAVVPIMAMTLPVLFYFAPPSINPTRLLLYVLLVLCAGVSTGFFAERAFSCRLS